MGNSFIYKSVLMNLTRRTAQAHDEDFLYALHKATMHDYVMETWGVWDELWQRERYRQNFQPQRLRVIQLDGQDIGMLHLQERTEELFLVNLEILPEFQKRGVGSQIIRQVIEEANQLGKPVALQVLKVNLAARALYQRLGFGVTGENDTHYIMAYEVL
jgi:ribosomal protein S18 acetylase RimI-like enzyme